MKSTRTRVSRDNNYRQDKIESIQLIFKQHYRIGLRKYMIYIMLPSYSTGGFELVWLYQLSTMHAFTQQYAELVTLPFLPIYYALLMSGWRSIKLQSTHLHACKGCVEVATYKVHLDTRSYSWTIKVSSWRLHGVVILNGFQVEQLEYTLFLTLVTVLLLRTDHDVTWSRIENCYHNMQLHGAILQPGLLWICWNHQHLFTIILSPINIVSQNKNWLCLKCQHQGRPLKTFQ